MNKDKLEKFNLEVKSGDIETAKKTLDEILSEPLTDEENGMIMFGATMAYMKLANELNSNYSKKLDELIKEIRMVDQADKQTVNKMRIEDVRQTM